eukprot:sb/3478765/
MVKKWRSNGAKRLKNAHFATQCPLSNEPKIHLDKKWLSYGQYSLVHVRICAKKCVTLPLTLTNSPNPLRAPKLRIVSNERHPDFNVFPIEPKKLNFLYI